MATRHKTEAEWGSNWSSSWFLARFTPPHLPLSFMWGRVLMDETRFFFFFFSPFPTFPLITNLFFLFISFFQCVPSPLSPPPPPPLPPPTSFWCCQNLGHSRGGGRNYLWSEMNSIGYRRFLCARVCFFLFLKKIFFFELSNVWSFLFSDWFAGKAFPRGLNMRSTRGIMVI